MTTHLSSLIHSDELSTMLRLHLQRAMKIHPSPWYDRHTMAGHDRQPTTIEEKRTLNKVSQLIISICFNDSVPKVICLKAEQFAN